MTESNTAATPDPNTEFETDPDFQKFEEYKPLLDAFSKLLPPHLTADGQIDSDLFDYNLNIDNWQLRNMLNDIAIFISNYDEKKTELKDFLTELLEQLKKIDIRAIQNYLLNQYAENDDLALLLNNFIHLHRAICQLNTTATVDYFVKFALADTFALFWKRLMPTVLERHIINNPQLWKTLTTMTECGLLNGEGLENYITDPEYPISFDSLLYNAKYFLEHYTNEEFIFSCVNDLRSLPSSSINTWVDAFIVPGIWEEYSKYFFEDLQSTHGLSKELVASLRTRWGQHFRDTDSEVEDLDYRERIMVRGFRKTIESIITLSRQTLTNEQGEQENYANFLHRVFGLADFGRYPIEHLERQAKTAFDRDRYYQPVLYPEECTNGAFYQDHDYFESLGADISANDPEAVFRYFEVGEGNRSLVAALQFCNKHYNTGHAQLLVIGAHGTDGKLSFSISGNHKLDFNDTAQQIEIINEISLLLHIQAPVAIIACTGYTENPLSAVQFISTSLPDTPVIGMSQPGHIQKLRGTHQGRQGRITIEARFKEGKTGKDITVVLIKGEMIIQPLP